MHYHGNSAKRPKGTEIRAFLRRLLRAVRSHWPKTQILLRGDSYYCCPEVLDWCRAGGHDFILGVAPTATLRRHITDLETSTRGRFDAALASGTGAGKMRRFKAFNDCAKSWSRVERIIARVEVGDQGADTRFIVTNLKKGSPRWLYEQVYCRRGQGLHHPTCLAHLDRKARFVEQHGSDFIGMRLKLWLDRAFGLARDIATLAASTVKGRRRALLRDLDAILGTATNCELAQELLGQIRRARDQLLTFCDFPGKIDATNNVSERALRPSVIQRKVTNGYRAKWAANAEADLRTTVDTARLSGDNPFHTILAAVSA